MQGWFNTIEFASEIYHTDRLMKERDMIISIDRDKALDKIQYLFLIKKYISQQTINRRGFINLIKCTTKYFWQTAFLMEKCWKHSL